MRSRPRRPLLVTTPGGDLAEITLSDDTPTWDTLRLDSLRERRHGRQTDVVIQSADEQIAYIGRAVAEIRYPA